MIVESDYRGYRIEVIACESKGGWDANVKIRRAVQVNDVRRTPDLPEANRAGR
jgi:hypothetical protein